MSNSSFLCCFRRKSSQSSRGNKYATKQEIRAVGISSNFTNGHSQASNLPPNPVMLQRNGSERRSCNLNSSTSRQSSSRNPSLAHSISPVTPFFVASNTSPSQPTFGQSLALVNQSSQFPANSAQQQPVPSQLPEAERLKRSEAIDRMLAREKQRLRREQRILLLGAGESGKSTFLKQMRIIHSSAPPTGEAEADADTGQSALAFTRDELLEFKRVIVQNIFRGMLLLVRAVRTFSMRLENEEHEQCASQLLECERSLRSDRRSSVRRSGRGSVRAATGAGGARGSVRAPTAAIVLSDEQLLRVRPALVTLWSDASVQLAFRHRSLFHLDYIPNSEDVLYARRPTKGVVDLNVRFNGQPFVFVDVGGQRSQRQKWAQCFQDGLVALLFMVASSEYDQTLLEDESTNRLHEATDVFDTVVNNRFLEHAALILFLNKSDVLREKLELARQSATASAPAIAQARSLALAETHSSSEAQAHEGTNTEQTLERRQSAPNLRLLPFAHYFPTFSGDSFDADAVQRFVGALFVSRVRDPHRLVYRHATTAVDTTNMRHVFNNVKHTVLMRNIQQVLLE